ncbi:excinuclease ABC subunit UvrC [Borreliella americana]|uniref:excinuclease ABC subunit UvrC n=1 Tax=Borreliella americana TaxID=478807 RepID=UPI001E540AD7|nr:excinuclease ABC subunit UvrC [Borreliella americana]MCD2331880.1 excinuclease ABC subunit UvrC [Borreliella americana]MCD2349168.1 excinuclease ABC subunit UvrC [Borreliella americana]MCD2382405.1 excinuclease ABC subunit UvrC [Borreliella americana]
MKENLTSLFEKVIKLPTTSGCYKMLNENKKILYIGKAKNLRSRVKSYFLEKNSHKIQILMKNVKSIEVITTNSEYEALLLECNLIKTHKPDYNVKLKDGKGYPMVRITHEKYPRIFKTRKIINDQSEYFGPFTNVKKLDQVLDFINKTFKIRKCKKKSSAPCLYYHMGQCLGVCYKENLEKEYQKELDKAKSILSGNISEILSQIDVKLKLAIQKEDFETAIKLKEIKSSLIEINQIQIVTKSNNLNIDYVHVHPGENVNTIIVLKYRNGKLVERDVNFDESICKENELILQFLIQYYTSINMIVPDKIHIFLKDIDTKNVEKLINEIKNIKTEIIYKETEEILKIMEMAISNAELSLREYENKNNKALESLKIVLEMDKLPKIIEGFDIAHLNGQETVASMVTFKMGIPLKENYRLYKLNSLLKGEIDDFKATKEVISRRYSEIINNNLELPNLILIDGGKGQLNAALSILKGLKIESKVKVCSLAKKQETIFLTTSKKGITLPQGHPALRILQNVRDEAHRKANGFNKKRREKTALLYTKIHGIGEKTAQKILKSIGTYRDILPLNKNEISKKIKVSIQLAKRIKEFAIKENSIKNYNQDK